MKSDDATLIIGGTSGLGLALARRQVARGETVIIAGRDAGRARAVAAEIGASGIAVDLSKPHDIAKALEGVGTVRRLVLSAIARDANTVRDYDIDGAAMRVTMKLVGYTEVVHALAGRLARDASVVLFGGLAMQRPYPGSTTVSTVNGGISAMVRTLAVELAPVRVNAIHPGVIGDSPAWEGKPPAMLEALAKRTPLGRLVTMEETTDATVFLMESGGVNGVNLVVDGGWLLT